MINWTNEQLQGEPVYNILGEGDASINGVHLRLANDIVRPGTPFSAANMNILMQKSHESRSFYYNGDHIATAAFPAADNGLREGVFLVKPSGGVELAAEGTVYIVTDGHTQRIENPRGWPIARDCAVYCQVGEKVWGSISWGDEDGN